MSPQHQRFHELACALCDGALGEAQFQELETLLESSRELRQLYLKHLWLHGELLWSEGDGAATRVAETLSQPGGRAAPSADRPRPASRLAQVREFFVRPTPLSITLALVVMAMVISVMALLVPPAFQHFARQPVELTGPKFVARLTDFHEAQWAEGQVGTSRGAHLRAGHRLNLLGGMAELTFDNGAQVVLDGPCEFVVQSTAEGSLRSGRLMAHVPQEATGFTVQTPTAKIVDLGTRFGVEVADSGTEVHVFQGKVEASLHASPDQRLQLIAGEALRFDVRTHRVQQLAAESKRFQALPDVAYAETVIVNASSVRNVGRQVLGQNFGLAASSLTINGVQFSSTDPPSGWMNGGGDFSVEHEGQLGELLGGLVFRNETSGSIALPTVPGRKYLLQLFFDNDVNDSGDGQVISLLGRPYVPAAPQREAASVVQAEFTARDSQTLLLFRTLSGRNVVINALCLHELPETTDKAPR